MRYSSDNVETQASTDPRARRHAEMKARILQEAWRIAARDGVAGISLSGLAKAVGLRQPSLYTYFDSKAGLFDEMFADGYRRAISAVVDQQYPDDPRDALKLFLRRCVAFSSTHPAEHTLLFQRPIPGFEPSTDSFALAERFYEPFRALMARIGIMKQADLDVLISLTQGLTDQQVANDPGGHRWADLVDDAVDMVLDRVHNGGGFGKRGRRR